MGKRRYRRLRPGVFGELFEIPCSGPRKKQHWTRMNESCSTSKELGPGYAHSVLLSLGTPVSPSTGRLQTRLGLRLRSRAMDAATVLEHYGIRDNFPDEWPADKDKDSDNEEEPPALPTKTALPVRRSKSRYSVLERRPGVRGSVPGSQKTSDGVENIVQRDEPDPLGAAPSVVQVLRQRGLAVQDDAKLRMYNFGFLKSLSFLEFLEENCKFLDFDVPLTFMQETDSSSHLLLSRPPCSCLRSTLKPQLKLSCPASTSSPAPSR